MRTMVLVDSFNDLFVLMFIVNGGFVPVATFNLESYKMFSESVGKALEKYDEMKLHDQTEEFIRSIERIDAIGGLACG